MANFLKLSDGVINLDWIRQIKFSPDPPIVWILWAIGCEDTDVAGEDALLLMDRLDDQSIPVTKMPLTNDDSTSD